MFCAQPNENTVLIENLHVASHLPLKKHRRKKKKYNKEGHKRKSKKNNPKFEYTMTTWAENFTVAATWQLKHQIAYWKARAKALEYENAVLHDIIRRNPGCLTTTISLDNEMKTETEVDTITDNDIESDVSSEREDNFEVSEEFITFLAANAKYKAEAKRERERLKAKQEAEDMESNAIHDVRESVEENKKRLEDLYGNKWQRISALEMSLMSTYINECDKSKPVYWPNIPFNFN